MKPISYISRSVTPTERRYAQIEKEALAITWACERFNDYLLGMEFHINTDHKPLVPLFGSKHLDELPLRIQRFRLRLMRFKFTISHVAGSKLWVADALSRAPCSEAGKEDILLQEETAAYVRCVVENLPATERRIRKHQERDEECKLASKYCQVGWPSGQFLPGILKPYRSVASELKTRDGLLMRGDRVIIPANLRPEVLDQLHTGHQGISKCRERAKLSVWWPGLSRQLEELVNNCLVCRKFTNQRSEPLMPSALPDLPWQKVGTDLFELKGKPHLLIVDYYSRFIEVAQLHRTTAEVIQKTKAIFARHGIPEVVVSDNGPQFSSEAYSAFARNYQFEHVTSSPLYPQSNGEAERAVQTVKSLLNKGEDPCLALLSYRSTPLKCGFSPSELLMVRKLRTTVPMTRESLKPVVPDPITLQERERKYRERTQRNYNQHHGVIDLGELEPGQRIWVPDREEEAHVAQGAGSQSYQVETDGGTYRRNR